MTSRPCCGDRFLVLPLFTEKQTICFQCGCCEPDGKELGLCLKFSTLCVSHTPDSLVAKSAGNLADGNIHSLSLCSQSFSTICNPIMENCHVWKTDTQRICLHHCHPPYSMGSELVIAVRELQVVDPHR